MAEDRVALVIGPTGAAGGPIVQALRRRGGWTILGLSRSAPREAGGFRHLAADLLDPASCRRALEGGPAVTHLFYAARAAHGESGVEDVPGNLGMLRAVLDAVEATSDRLRHVHLLEGLKWYGMHLGPYRTPSREDDPRHMPPNFYYDQQDLLAERQRGRNWHWSASRPSFLCDFDPNRARNIVSTLGAYAAICREYGVPMDYPGTEAGFASISEMMDARLLGEAIAFLATEANASDAAFNVSNGDCFRWRDIWPHLAELFGVRPGVPRDMRLATWMADKQAAWDVIAGRHGLGEKRLDHVADWPFGDFVFRQDWDVLSDLNRLRRAGFTDSVDSYEMFTRQVGQYRAARLLP